MLCSPVYGGGSEEIRIRGVRMLIEAGASVRRDSRSSAGYQLPLGIAAACGQLQIVKMLLEAGADVHESRPPDRLTALHAAVESNLNSLGWANPLRARVGSAFDIAAVLLAAGADPNAVTDLRTTPLLESASTRKDPSRQHMDAVLLRGGARLDHYVRDELQSIAPPRHRTRGWTPYLDKVYQAGGWKRYAHAHRKRLADMFAPKLRLPADVIPLVVDFWANVGMY